MDFMEQQAAGTATAVRSARGRFMRRGLMALGAGLIAGIAPKWSAKPVSAGNGENWSIGNTASTPQTATSTTQLSATGAGIGGVLKLIVPSGGGRGLFVDVQAGSDNAIYAQSIGGSAIFATSTSNAGIWGQATSSFGLLGTSQNGTGLYGASYGTQPGLYGVSTGGIGVRADSGLNPVTTLPNSNQSSAVYGKAWAGGVGLEGESASAIAVKGTSTSSTGVYGTSTGGQGVYGNSTNNAGVQGQSTNSIGVLGQGTTGVFGIASGAGIGVQATSTAVALRANGRSELYGDVEIGDFEAVGGTAYNLNVTGELRVNGQKMAVVQAADGQYHQFYCLESAESYFEDFGVVRLSGGSVRVNIPEDFRQFVAPERGFYVQLTPLGDSGSLYVANLDVMGFDIKEAGNGKSTVDVQYRIVCRRRDVEGKRLQRVNPAERRPGERKLEEHEVRPNLVSPRVEPNAEQRRDSAARPPVAPPEPERGR